MTIKTPVRLEVLEDFQLGNYGPWDMTGRESAMFRDVHKAVDAYLSVRAAFESGMLGEWLQSIVNVLTPYTDRQQGIWDGFASERETELRKLLGMT